RNWHQQLDRIMRQASRRRRGAIVSGRPIGDLLCRGEMLSIRRQKIEQVVPFESINLVLSRISVGRSNGSQRQNELVIVQADLRAAAVCESAEAHGKAPQ